MALFCLIFPSQNGKRLYGVSGLTAGEVWVKRNTEALAMY